MKHLRMLGIVAAMAMALTAIVGVASASAHGIMPGSTGFTGTGTVLETQKVGGVTHSWTSTFTTNGGSGPYAKCEETEFTGTTQAGTTEEVTVTPHYRKCFSNIGGSFVTAEVETPLVWHLKIGTVTLPTYTGTVKVTGPVKIKVPAVACEITVGEQEVAAEGRNDTGTPPAGTEVNTATAGITVAYTGNTGCTSNGVNNGNSVYKGAVHIPTIYVE
jgi:hypothetical protein